jgi:hypothetical protein
MAHYQAMFWLPKFKHLDYRVHIAVPSNIWRHWRLTFPYANLHALFTWNLLLQAGAENSVGKAPSICNATFLWGCYALQTWCSRTCPLLHSQAHHLRGSPGLGFWTLAELPVVSSFIWALVWPFNPCFIPSLSVFFVMWKKLGVVS